MELIRELSYCMKELYNLTHPKIHKRAFLFHWSITMKRQIYQLIQRELLNSITKPTYSIA